MCITMPISCICCMHVWTTHEEYLAFIVVQNLVGIDAAVMIICKFIHFAKLACKYCSFWVFLLGSHINKTPIRHILAQKNIV